MKIDILGTNYTIIESDEKKDKNLEGRFGYCTKNDKRIVVADFNTLEGWKDEPEEVKEVERKSTLRHEIIHAFLNESGLSGSTNYSDSWATNEEMIDWVALQFPKILKVYEKVGCI